MSKFENVTVTKAANIYFDGQVTSRALVLADGSKVTLGIMQPGEYEFATAQPELMEITAGRLDVQLPGQTEWQQITGGESFRVQGDASFKLKVHELTDYCCRYLQN